MVDTIITGIAIGQVKNTDPSEHLEKNLFERLGPDSEVSTTFL